MTRRSPSWRTGNRPNGGSSPPRLGGSSPWLAFSITTAARRTKLSATAQANGRQTGMVCARTKASLSSSGGKAGVSTAGAGKGSSTPSSTGGAASTADAASPTSGIGAGGRRGSSGTGKGCKGSCSPSSTGGSPDGQKTIASKITATSAAPIQRLAKTRGLFMVEAGCPAAQATEICRRRQIRHGIGCGSV